MKNYGDIFSDLKSCCRWNYPEEVKKIFKKNTSIDVLYDDGMLLKIAISSSFCEIIKILLDHFYKTDYTIDQEEELLEILQDEVDTFNPSKKMLKILDPYLAKGREQDLSGFDDIDDTSTVGIDEATNSPSSIDANQPEQLSMELLGVEA